jgi:hypothetical protein
MFSESILIMFAELIDFVILEMVELSCAGPSKEEGGARSGLGLSVATLWTARCRRRRTIVFREDDESALTDTVLLAGDEVSISLWWCGRPRLLSETFELVDWR